MVGARSQQIIQVRTRHFTINPTISTPIQHTPTGYVHTRRNLPYLIPNCEAKSSWAGLVLAWGTSWEPHGDVTFFFRQHTLNRLRFMLRHFFCTSIAMSLPPYAITETPVLTPQNPLTKLGDDPGLCPRRPHKRRHCPPKPTDKNGDSLPAAQSHWKRPQKTTDKVGDVPAAKATGNAPRNRLTKNGDAPSGQSH